MNTCEPTEQERAPSSGGHGDTRDDTTSLFEATALWRAEIIAEFRLRGEERCAAASPVCGFPRILSHVLEVARVMPRGLWLDVGGGLGGVASWLERQTHQRVISMDPSPDSVRAARQLFPHLTVAVADGARLPLGAGTVAAVLLSGVMSLDLETSTILTEVRRVLAPEGLMVVADLWSATSEPYVSEPNRFWSLVDFESLCRDVGLDDDYWAVCDTSLGWWPAAATQIEEELERRHGHDVRYRRHRADEEHIRRQIDAGKLVAATGIFRVR